MSSKNRKKPNVFGQYDVPNSRLVRPGCHACQRSDWNVLLITACHHSVARAERNASVPTALVSFTICRRTPTATTQLPGAARLVKTEQYANGDWIFGVLPCLA